MNFVKHISKALSTFFIVALISCSDSAPESMPQAEVKQPVELCDKDEIQHSKLLTIQEANGLLDNPNYLFVEVSKEEEYDKGHIPKALNIWRPDFRSKNKTPVTGIRCSPDEFNTFLQSLGMTDAATLVVYDAKGGSDALRLAWVLDYYDFQKYKVINGGKKAWSLAGYPLSPERTKAKTNINFSFEVKENRDILAEHQDVLAAIRDTNTLIVDTREQYEYDGQCFVHQGKVLSHKKGAFDRGRIPTSIHLNWSTLSDLANDHRIKCPKDLKYDLAKKGITKDKNIIVYCQSGSRSSHTAFVLKEILDYPNVKNYDGSWIEWSYLAQQGKTPIKKHISVEDFEKEEQRLTASLKNSKQ